MPNRKQVAEEAEWRVVETALPAGWKEAAGNQGEFCRARFLSDPTQLLWVLLLHAVNDAGSQETVTQPRASKIAEMSQVALLKRLRTVAGGLAGVVWIAPEFRNSLHPQARLPQGLCLYRRMGQECSHANF